MVWEAASTETYQNTMIERKKNGENFGKLQALASADKNWKRFFVFAKKEVRSGTHLRQPDVFRKLLFLFKSTAEKH